MTPSRRSITNSELEAARNRWLSVRPEFERFGVLLETRLAKALADSGIRAEVTSRAKEVHSLIKKLILKPQHTFDSLPDKAGVRVCVRFTREIPVVVEIVQRLFS